MTQITQMVSLIDLAVVSTVIAFNEPAAFKICKKVHSAYALMTCGDRCTHDYFNAERVRTQMSCLVCPARASVS